MNQAKGNCPNKQNLASEKQTADVAEIKIVRVNYKP